MKSLRTYTRVVLLLLMVTLSLRIIPFAYAVDPTSTAASTPATTTSSTTPSITCGSDTQICNPVGNGNVSDITTLLVTIIKYALGLIGILAVLMIIVGGYQLVISAGNPEGQKKGRQTVIYAVSGLLLAVLSYSIIAIIENAINNQSGNGSTPSYQNITGGSGSSSSSSTTGGTNTTGGSSGTGTTPVNNPTNPGTPVSQQPALPNTSATCSSAGVGSVNVDVASGTPNPVYVDDAKGSDNIDYVVTPGNAAAQACTGLAFSTYVFDSSQGAAAPQVAPNSSTGTQVDSGTGFGTNGFSIPENFSQDTGVDFCVYYTTLTPVLSDCAHIDITNSQSAASGSICNASDLDMEVSAPSSVDVDSNGNASIDYTVSLQGNPPATCTGQRFYTYVFEEAVNIPSSPPSQNSDDSGSFGDGGDTVDVPSSFTANGDDAVTIGVYYTDSSGNVEQASATVQLNYPSDSSSTGSGNDGSGDNGSGDNGGGNGGTGDNCQDYGIDC